jgi:Tfp pilus assembly protein PilN
MITNLLPPQTKDELYEEEIKKMIIISGILILIFLFSSTLILFTINNYILKQIDLEKTVINLEEKNSEAPEIQNLREKIISINRTLSQLDSFYQAQVRLTEIFNKISDILPSQMYLTNFSYQKESAQVSLSGFSPNREILFEFKKTLEKEFPEANFPPQNWIKATDIDFQVNFKITKQFEGSD